MWLMPNALVLNVAPVSYEFEKELLWNAPACFMILKDNTHKDAQAGDIGANI